MAAEKNQYAEQRKDGRRKRVYGTAENTDKNRESTG